MKTDTAPAVVDHDDDQSPAVRNDGYDGNARASLPYGGDQVMRGTAHYPDEHRDLVRWLFFHCVEEGIVLKDVCRKMKRDASTISRVLIGSYRNPNTGAPVDLTNIVADIKKYRDRWQVERDANNQFHYIHTPVIGVNSWSICDFAADTGTIAFIWGESQTGKSWALRAYQRAHNHGRSRYCSLLPASGQLMMLREIARACGISAKTSYDKLIDRIIKSLDKSNLLIVDELHQVTTTYHARSKINCLELLRTIHDRSGCGMVLCGTNTFRDEVQEGRDKKLLEQLRKRGPAVFQCPSHAPEADVDALVAGWKLPRIPDALRDEVMGLVIERGLLVFTTFIKSGQRLAAKDKQAFTWQHFIRFLRIMQKLNPPSK
jgi:DNA transposition AAA+ family ATPase